ncbi:MAG: energy-coupling factor transporter transmembrane component T [Actinomycetes bacterium]
MGPGPAPVTGGGYRMARALHPGAWWLWALGLAGAASRTTNPLLLALILAVVAYVVAARRPDSPGTGAFAAALRLGALIVVIRLVVAAAFGAPLPGHVLLSLPQVPLPSWAAGVRIGGPVTTEGLVAAAGTGGQLATVVICLGAANTLGSPRRLLRSVPAALYEVGVAVVVALSVTPALITTTARVREARRLRGHPDRGLGGLRRVALPVLAEALDQAVELAAAMDSRGFGRRAPISSAARRVAAGLTLTGLVGVCLGVFGLLDAGTPGLLGLPVLLAGLMAAAGGFTLAGRRQIRTRYRPEPWRTGEWLTSLAGMAAVAGLLAAAAQGVPGLTGTTTPLAWPTLPLLPAAGILLGLVPAHATPPLPSSQTHRAGEAR